MQPARWRRMLLLLPTAPRAAIILVIIGIATRSFFFNFVAGHLNVTVDARSQVLLLLKFQNWVPSIELFSDLLANLCHDYERYAFVSTSPLVPATEYVFKMCAPGTDFLLKGPW